MCRAKCEQDDTPCVVVGEVPVRRTLNGRFGVNPTRTHCRLLYSNGNHQVLQKQQRLSGEDTDCRVCICTVFELTPRDLYFKV